MVQKPAGVPVGTLAIGRSGAVTAALLAAAMVGGGTDKLAREVNRRLKEHRARQTAVVLENRDPSKGDK